MPTYEYECAACGHTLEQFQSITSAPLKKCPECGKRKLRRLIGSGSAIIFKGSGFYCTDYRSESYQSSAKADKAKSDTSSSSSSSDSKSDSKSDSSKDSTKDAKKS